MVKFTQQNKLKGNGMKLVNMQGIKVKYILFCMTAVYIASLHS